MYIVPSRERGGKMTLTNAVIERLNNLIAEKGINQYKIYKDGGVARSTISQLLSGKRERIELQTLYEIISTMGITLQEFFSDPLFDEITD